MYIVYNEMTNAIVGRYQDNLTAVGKAQQLTDEHYWSTCDSFNVRVDLCT